MCAITSSSAWSGIKMCLAQQNSDGEESHDGLTDEKSTQIAADAVDGEGKQHKEDADAAGNQIQHESDAPGSRARAEYCSASRRGTGKDRSSRASV